MDMSRINRKWVFRGLLAVVLVTVGWQAGKAMLYDPLVKDRESIEKSEKTLEGLRLQKEVEAPGASKRWQALAALTLSTDETEVKNALSQELMRLAVASKLLKPSVRPRKLLKSKKSKGVVRVPISVMAQGKLDQVARFLGAVYDLPYLVRVREVRISPTGGKGSELVALSLQVESLVLPETSKNRKFVRGTKTFDLSVNPEERLPRDPPVLDRPIEEYAALAERHPFHGYRPPPKIASRPVRTARSSRFGGRGSRRTTRTPPPAADPRTFTKVESSLSYPGVQGLVQEVGLRNTKTKARILLRVGDELKVLDAKGAGTPEGRIILVHPYGFVTQSGDERRFYARGMLLSDAEVVGENTEPAIRAALAVLDGQQSE